MTSVSITTFVQAAPDDRQLTVAADGTTVHVELKVTTNDPTGEADDAGAEVTAPVEHVFTADVDLLQAAVSLHYPTALSTGISMYPAIQVNRPDKETFAISVPEWCIDTDERFHRGSS